MYELKFVDAIKKLSTARSAAKQFPSTTLIQLYELLKSERQQSCLRKCSKSTYERSQIYGGGERDRTDDPLLAKQVLSQLSYTPSSDGGSGWIRTNDPRLIKTVL